MDTGILEKGILELGSPVSDDILKKFGIYFHMLEEKNKVMNLTAISGEEDVSRLHFLDCLCIMKYADFKGKTAVDIGSGAGFPGLPIKIMEPDLELKMIDSLNKRVKFLNEVIAEAELSGAQAVHGRAEEEALKKENRDSFDYALSRAVARLPVLTELCLPYVKPGGTFIAMKSTDSEEEINEAKAAVKLLGGHVQKIEDYRIPETDVVHRAVIIEKVSPTPKGYPRRFAKIQQSPIK